MTDPIRSSDTPSPQWFTRLHDSGEVDEVVARRCTLHLEQLAPDLIWVGLWDADTNAELCHITISPKGKSRALEVRVDREAPAEEKTA